MGKKRGGKKKGAGGGSSAPSASVAAAATNTVDELREIDEQIKMMMNATAAPSQSPWHRVQDVLKAIDAVIKLQKKVALCHKPVHTLDRKKALERFEVWLGERGMDQETRKWRFEQMETSGFGVIASANSREEGAAGAAKTDKSAKIRAVVAANEVVVATPIKMCLTTNTALEDPQLGPALANDEFLAEKPTLCLAMHLLVERKKGARSSWATYIDTLPREFSVPHFWSVNDFYSFRGSTSFLSAVKTICSLVYAYAYVYEKIRSGEISLGEEWGSDESAGFAFTFEDFRWAVCVAMTRQNPIPSASGENMILALIPIMDMFNHDLGTNMPYYDAEKDAVCVTASKAHVDGEEIFMSYGSRPNRELLLYSGHVVRPNPHDNVQVFLRLDDADPLCKVRRLLLMKEDIAPKSPDGAYTFHILYNGEPSKGLWIFAHIFFLPKEAIAEVMRNAGEDEMVRSQLITSVMCVGVDVRRKAVEYMKRVIGTMLASIDSKKTSGGKHFTGPSKASGNLRLIEDAIACERHCLLECVKWCDAIGLTPCVFRDSSAQMNTAKTR